MKKNRILLIEDNPDHADLIINALNDEGAGNGDKDVFLIKDGQDAIDFFDENDLPEEYFQIELILLDINLPKVNGMDILKYIRKTPGYSETPVTIMSTDSRKDTVGKAYRYGANSYIEKLVSYDKLVEKLKNVKDLFTRSYAFS
ncbi:MAG: response regulator [Candidatus Scalindua sp.]|nr:response regulator [Candidatus Scalindua sp.]MDV5166175.1 response regulator [Candidatus Scalindua sp.]